MSSLNFLQPIFEYTEDVAGSDYVLYTLYTARRHYTYKLGIHIRMSLCKYFSFNKKRLNSAHRIVSLCFHLILDFKVKELWLVNE